MRRTGHSAKLLCALFGLVLGLTLFMGIKVVHPPAAEVLEEEFKTADPPTAEIPEEEFKEILDTPIPKIEMESLEGEETISSRYYIDQAYLLVFADSDCLICDEIYPQLREASGVLPLLIVSGGSRQEMVNKLHEYRLDTPVAYDPFHVLGKALSVSGVPTAMYINFQGHVVEATSGGLSTKKLIRSAMKMMGSDN